MTSGKHAIARTCPRCRLQPRTGSFFIDWKLTSAQHNHGLRLSHDTLLDATNSVNTTLAGMFVPMVSASPVCQVQLVH